MSAQSQDTIRSAITHLGLAGRPVCVHSSMRSFSDRLDVDDLLDALLDEGCTVLVPTYSWNHYAVPAPQHLRPARNGTDYTRTWATSGASAIFDPTSPQLDVEEMGQLPAALLRRSQRRRGSHPLTSFASLGPLADELVADQSPTIPFAPLRALVDLDGAILLIGVDLTAMTLIHLAEFDAGRVPFQRWALGADGAVIMVSVGGCSHGFGQLDEALETHARHTVVAGSSWTVYAAGPALAAATEAIERHSAITSCRLRCERCIDAVQGGPVLR